MAGKILYDIWLAAQFLIGYNLFFPLCLYFFYITRILGKKNNSIASKKPQADYAIIVTAYEQLDTVPAVVASILEMDYENYVVYVVADKCDISSLKFDDKKVVVLRPPDTLASNTRSHFYAINNFVRPHERLTIIDSDNLVHPNYLHELNKCFNDGFIAVQGERKAKNLDTVFSCLDAGRDVYYHFYDGKVLFALGSSATLAGSGMAFTVALYKECLGHLDITGAGFDKVLQKEIVGRGHRIAFNENAIVYDEKTSQSGQLVNQRARWINTWFRYVTFGFDVLIKGIAHINLNQMLFGIVLLRPPLFLFILASFVCCFVDFFVSPLLMIFWTLGFLAFFLGFFVALWSSDTDPLIYRSLWGIPKFVSLQVQSLLKARNANKRSVATKHFHSNKIDEIKK